ncbi:hypothetical protein ACLPJK_25775 [Pseudomonas aeruginosa]|uniref:hypothetical protein n=1 Tax=Pseudomonas aeruginosa TaxID=287 RepID=UPI003D2B0F4F
MKTLYALQVAGEKALGDYSWGEELIRSLNLYFPRSMALTASTTGTQALVQIDTLPPELAAQLLELNVDTTSRTNTATALTPQPTAAVVEKLPLRKQAFAFVMIGLTMVLLIGAGILMTNLANTSFVDNENKVGTFKQFADVLVEIIQSLSSL